MMKPTSNTVPMNGKQREVDQRRSQRGEVGGRGGRVRPLLIVLPVFSLRGEGGDVCEEWRVGFAPRAAVKALCPLRARQQASDELPIGHAEHLIDTHNQLLLLTPSPSHPPLTNKHIPCTITCPGLIEIQKEASTPQAKTAAGRRGVVAVVAHGGPIKNRC